MKSQITNEQQNLGIKVEELESAKEKFIKLCNTIINIGKKDLNQKYLTPPVK